MASDGRKNASRCVKSCATHKKPAMSSEVQDQSHSTVPNLFDYTRAIGLKIVIKIRLRLVEKLSSSHETQAKPFDLRCRPVCFRWNNIEMKFFVIY